ncbi:MAG: endonuclease/exonuclease/phosphatase family protein, partial [Candidatus Cloacimonetes bacterium]|nr:endonuclease/exonuclease/phosphatase family protein [Candidatus Cloacimonadota bacterium]
MPAIKYDGPDFDYNLNDELQAIRRLQLHRGIPERTASNLLLASWNLCNLGDEFQTRLPSDLILMAEILRPFDLIAVQEIKDNFRPLRDIVHLLGAEYDYLITDRAGNDERLGFIYDTRRVERLQLAAELVILKKERKTVEVIYNNKKEKAKFTGFNRNPYIAAFRSGQFSFTLANVHILFGSGKRGYLRRIAEVFNLARWAHNRVTEKAERTFDHDIILIGDFNIPKATTTDRVGKQLIKYGMQLTNHGSQTGSNLAGTEHYDQIAFHPDRTSEKFAGRSGVFDFDKCLFSDIYQQHPEHFNPINAIEFPNPINLCIFNC